MDFFARARVRSFIGAIFLALTAWLVRASLVGLLVAPSSAHATLPPEEECKDRGGYAECTRVQRSPWTYNLCDQMTSVSADPVRDHCEAYAFESVTSTNMTSLIAQFEACVAAANYGPLCNNHAQLEEDWGAYAGPGGCYPGGTEYSNGEETRSLRRFNASGSAGGNCEHQWNDDQFGLRQRNVYCPAGYQIRTAPDGTHAECWRPTYKTCPQCGDPVQMTNGEYHLAETDYVGRGPQPLEFTRHYRSGGYYRPLNSTDDRHPQLGDYWYTTYDRRLYVLPGSTYAMATVTRPDGEVKYFDLSGNEIGHQNELVDHLEQISGGGWRLHTGNDDVETYDAAGNLIQITNRQGLSQTLTYSDVNTPPDDAPYPGLLMQVTDAFGRSLQFKYDQDGMLHAMFDPAGTGYGYNYNADGVLISVVYAGTGNPPGIKRYVYEGAALRDSQPEQVNLITGVIDENQQRASTIHYRSLTNQFGVVESIDEVGGTYRYVYGTDGVGNFVGIIDPTNLGTAFYRNSQAGVTRTTRLSKPCAECPRGVASYTFDANGFIASRTDWDNNVTTYLHDGLGRETSRTEAFGTALARTISTQWSSQFNLPTEIDEPGRTTTFVYDGNGNKLSETITDTATNESRTTTWTYNANGQVLTVDGPRTDISDVTSYTYDSQGNLFTITDALGHQTTLDEYDANGNPGRIIDANGVATTMTYDVRSHLRTRTVANATTTFAYDLAGQLIKTTMPDGSYLQNTYDAAHRLTDVTDNLGNKIHYTLDFRGNRTRTDVKDPTGALKRTQSQVFDLYGRLGEVHGANSQVTIYGYDDQGNRTSETIRQASGDLVTTTTYDALNRAKTVTDAGNGITTYGYDSLSQLTSVEDPTHLTTTYAYNSFGNLKTLVSPDTGTTSYTYDAAGNRLSQTDARGVVTNYTYDALNRTTTVDYPGTAEDVAYFYDGVGTVGAGVANGIGRLTGVSDASGTTAYGYTARGQVDHQTATISAVPYTVAYSYDDADRLTGETYPSGRTVTYSRDAIGRVSGVSTTSGGVTTTLANSISYLPFGPAKGWTLGNGIAVSHSFDQDYRLTNLTDGSVLNRTLTYDARNLITGITDNLAAANSQTVTYDALARLSTASGAYGSLSYTYNGTGDRLTETRGAVTDTYAYAAGTHHLSTISGGRTVTFGYDAAGNTTSRNSQALTYNKANRLSTAAQNSTTEQNTYNASGQRTKKTVGGIETRFVHDRDGNIIMELGTQLLSEANAEYVWLDGKPLAKFNTFTRHEVIVDNASVGFSSSGFWTAAVATSETYGADYSSHAAGAPIGTAVVDDSEILSGRASFTGIWIAGPCEGVWDQSGCYGGEWMYAPQVTGNTGAFRWRTTLATAGRYDVYARWLSHSSFTNHATYSIVHAGGTSSVVVNQQAGGSMWQSLGLYNFLSGNAQISLSTVGGGGLMGGNGAPNADAVRFVPLDNLDQAHWAPPDMVTYDVYVRWPSFGTQSPSAIYTVKDSGGSSDHIVNQQTSGGAWTLLGTYTFTDLIAQGVTLYADPDYPVAADAVRFVPSGSSASTSSSAYFHTDHLGTPQRMTDASGNVVWDASYEPFGAVALNAAGITNSLRFPGQYFDAEMGLSQNWHRDYDASIGRYIESDPMGLEAGLNTFGYARQDPMDLADPSGLHAYWPPDPNKNTIVCDGKGGIEVQIAPISPLNRKCIGDCIRKHELSHITDAVTSGPSGCKGKPKGTIIGADTEDQRKASERKAYDLEISCLQSKLTDPKMCECSSIIRQRIQLLTDDRKRFE